MTTFADILTEANQILEMTDVFTGRYITTARAKMEAPSIVIPATDTRQGEAKIPIAKPNGTNR